MQLRLSFALVFLIVTLLHRSGNVELNPGLPPMNGNTRQIQLQTNNRSLSVDNIDRTSTRNEGSVATRLLTKRAESRSTCCTFCHSFASNTIVEICSSFFFFFFFLLSLVFLSFIRFSLPRCCWSFVVLCSLVLFLSFLSFPASSGLLYFSWEFFNLYLFILEGSDSLVSISGFRPLPG